MKIDSDKIIGYDLDNSTQARCSECGSVESFEAVYIPGARIWEGFYIGMYYFSFVLAGLCLLPLPFYFEDYTLFFVGLFFFSLVIMRPFFRYKSARVETLANSRCTVCGHYLLSEADLLEIKLVEAELKKRRSLWTKWQLSKGRITEEDEALSIEIEEKFKKKRRLGQGEFSEK